MDRAVFLAISAVGQKTERKRLMALEQPISYGAYCLAGMQRYNFDSLSASARELREPEMLLNMCTDGNAIELSALCRIDVRLSGSDYPQDPHRI